MLSPDYSPITVIDIVITIFYNFKIHVTKGYRLYFYNFVSHHDYLIDL